MQHPDEDDLALVALGENVPQVRLHLASCAACSREVDALSATVRAARQVGPETLPPAPEMVWARVTRELDLGSPDEAPRGGRPRLLAGAVAVAAAVLVLVLALVLPGVLPDGSPPPQVTPTAALAPYGDQRVGSGEVSLDDVEGRWSLRVETQGLASPGSDFYEVWLIDPASNRLVALGTLDPAGRADLTIPTGIRLGRYPVVDVSLEPQDGDPTHSGVSVLRGPLPL